MCDSARWRHGMPVPDGRGNLALTFAPRGKRLRIKQGDGGGLELSP